MSVFLIVSYHRQIDSSVSYKTYVKVCLQVVQQGRPDRQMLLDKDPASLEEEFLHQFHNILETSQRKQ